MIDVVLLGTGGMQPLPDRWLSSLLIRVNGELTLFDCGEGTQIAWRRAGWSFRRLGAIVISHTHADHIAGLPGLLHAVANTGRVEPIEIFGPMGTSDVVRGLRSIAPVLPYAVRVTELGDDQAFSLPGGLIGSCVEGEHALPVLAYRVDLRRSREFLPGRARQLGVPIELWRRLQQGETAEVADRRTVGPDDVLGPVRRGVAIAYVTDTRPLPRLATLAAGVDLLVCEGTYGDDGDAFKAERNRHMTFREAATIASDARAHRLWITHFSPGMGNPQSFSPAATGVFPAAVIGHDGLITRLSYSSS